MKILLKNIGTLYRIAAAGEKLKKGVEMENAEAIERAFVLIDEDLISACGPMNELKDNDTLDAQVWDCSGRIVFPGFCDSHTHIIFAKTREAEFVDRIRGLSYEEVARRGGGILNSAKRLRSTSDEELLKGAVARAWEVLRTGTTTIEIKSGYGLTVKDELRMLRVAKQVPLHCPIDVHTTFLGAHAIPAEYKDKRESYIKLICEEMIPAVSEEKLARFIDVFCDKGFFTQEETETILSRGKEFGMIPKIHANELGVTGGVQAGVKYGALSVDHLEHTTEAEIDCLLESDTMPVALPGTSFFLRIPYTQGRVFIDCGLPLALASDYNPGSSPGGSMPFIMALACTQMKIMPEEALCATTLNGAYALGVSSGTGSIEVGKRADIVISKPIDSLARIPYSFASNLVETVISKGYIVTNTPEENK